MEDELEKKLKKVLELVSDLAPNPLGASELLQRKAYEHRRARGIALSLLPVLLIALFLAVTAFPVFAGQENLYQFYASRRIAGEVESWNSLALGKTGEESLAQELGITEEEIQALRASGYGYGEIVLMVQLSRTSGEELSKIKEMREEGLGWGRIAAELGVSWRSISQEISQERGKFQQKMEAENPGGPKVQGKPEDNASPPGQQGPPENKGPHNSATPTGSQNSSTPSDNSTNSLQREKESTLLTPGPAGEGQEKKDNSHQENRREQDPFLGSPENRVQGNHPGALEHPGKGKSP